MSCTQISWDQQTPSFGTRNFVLLQSTLYHFHFSNEHDLNNESWAVLVPAFLGYRTQRIWKLESTVLGMARFHDQVQRLSGTLKAVTSQKVTTSYFHCVKDFVKYPAVQWSHDLTSYYTLIDDYLQNRRKACSCNCFLVIQGYYLVCILTCN